MIRVIKITKRYGTQEAIQAMELEIRENEILAVVGPSGCGKTTLLRLLAGFESPDSGEISIDGEEASIIHKMIPPHKREISLIFQDLALWPHMTVAEHIRFVLRSGNLEGDRLVAAIESVLRSVGLNGYTNRYPNQLSGGEKQRLAIARAIASKKKYLLMDEPLSSLDPLLKKELEGVILRLRETLGIGIVYVTHNMDEAFAMADRIAVMKKGQLEQIGTKDDLIGNPRNDFVRKFLELSSS